MQKSFPVTRNQTVIGRGGSSFWVDLQLPGPSDISREHCRLRRDPQSGAFFLKDISQFGTSIDGRRVPPSMADGRDQNRETKLLSGCRIGLADVIFLEFEMAGRG